MSKPKRIRPLPSVEFLRECFDYDQETGELRWRVRPRSHFSRDNEWNRCNKILAGTIAGYVNDGYRVVGIRGINNYLVHRVISKMMTGEEPPETVDHDDGDTLNNRWMNLRDATMSEQMFNKAINRNNTSGYRGVSWTSAGRKNWRAEIMIDGVSRFLGVFHTPEDASAAYEAAARELHREFYLRHGERK